MKTLHFSIIIILVLCNSEVVYAQYGNEASNPSHQSALQKELDLARTHIEITQQEKQQVKNISDAIILAEAGIPIAAGISIGVLLFTRKRI